MNISEENWDYLWNIKRKNRLKSLNESLSLLIKELNLKIIQNNKK